MKIYFITFLIPQSILGYKKVEGAEGLYYRKNVKGSRAYYVRLHWRQAGKKCTTFRSLKIEKISVSKQRLRDTRQDEPSGTPIFKRKDIQRALNGACERAGISRLTHHDFRHFFATICIESGVDIPTVSRWLGHNDGGALAMKIYGHLRDEHSQSAAEKVLF